MIQREIELHQHDLADYLTCKFKYYFNHVMGYVPRHYRRAINIGGVFAESVYSLHNGEELSFCLAKVQALQDDIIKSLSTKENIAGLEEDTAIIKAMIYGYNDRFMKGTQIQVPVIKQLFPEYHITKTVKTCGFTFKLITRLDGKIIDDKNRLWVLELKTSSGVTKDLVDELPTNFQINTYNTSLSTEGHVAGVLYRFIEKPTIRQKKGETHDQFIRRIAMDYVDRSERYFYEESFFFDDTHTKRFEEDQILHFGEMARSYVTDRWPRNGTACRTKYGSLCENIKYCKSPTKETLETYYVKEEEHEAAPTGGTHREDIQVGSGDKAGVDCSKYL